MKDYFKVKINQANLLAIPIESTREVINVLKSDICPICGVNSAILGVINHRGKLLWIVELENLLELNLNYGGEKQNKPHEKLTIIILKNQEKQIGAVVNDLKEIVSLDLDQFELRDSNLPIKTYLNSEEISEKILDVDAVFTALQTCVVNNKI